MTLSLQKKTWIFYNMTMVQLQNKLYRFLVSVLSILDKNFGDENSMDDLLSFHRLIVFRFKRIITVL